MIDGNDDRTLAAMIASGSRERVKRPRRCSHTETANHRTIGFGLRTGRPIGAQTARAGNRADGADPSPGSRSTGQLPAGDGARDPEVAICAHPDLGEVRNEASPSCRDLWGYDRRDRLHSAQSVTALCLSAAGATLAPPVKGKRHRGGCGAFYSRAAARRLGGTTFRADTAFYEFRTPGPSPSSVTGVAASPST